MSSTQTKKCFSLGSGLRPLRQYAIDKEHLLLKEIGISAKTRIGCKSAIGLVQVFLRLSDRTLEFAALSNRSEPILGSAYRLQQSRVTMLSVIDAAKILGISARTM